MSLRYVQFRKRSDPEKILGGVLSQNGQGIIDLKSQGKLPFDVNSFVRCDPEFLQQGLSKLSSQPITDDFEITAPVLKPEKIICVGLNYRNNSVEQKKDGPTEPIFFNKLANSIVGPNDDVVLPDITNQLDYEIELAVVIGKQAKNVRKEEAYDYVFGYTIAQDISARDWIGTINGGQCLLGKTMDSFCPLGPAIVHKSLVGDINNLTLSCKVNGEQRQLGNTKDLIFKVDDIVHKLSQYFTLKPGDIILTGTPAGLGCERNPPEWLKDGDVIESEIENIGKMRNRVVAVKNKK